MNIMIQLNSPNEGKVGFMLETVRDRELFFFWVTSTTENHSPSSELMTPCLPHTAFNNPLFTALSLLQKSSAHGASQGNNADQGTCPQSRQLKHRRGQVGSGEMDAEQYWPRSLNQLRSGVTLLISSHGLLDDLQHLHSVFFFHVWS